MRTHHCFVGLLVLACAGAVHSQSGTAFTYQGRLRDMGAPANGNYEVAFSLSPAAPGAGCAGTMPATQTVFATEGVFTASVDFGAVFVGQNAFLEIALRRAGAPDPLQVLAPRTPVTPAPGSHYAQFAGATGMDSVTGGSVVDGTLAAADIGSAAVGTAEIDATQVQRRIANACPPGQTITQVNEDGSVACDLDDVGTFSGWALTGNADIVPGTSYLGTSNSVALEMRVNNRRALRLEPVAVSPNVVGGHSANATTAGVRGATIGGGGVFDPAIVPDPDPDFAFEAPNRVTDAYGTIGGGFANRAGNDTGSSSDRPFAHVGGGSNNIASGESSNISGGGGHLASGFVATIGGGVSNQATGDGSTVGGGGVNIAAGRAATVPGGDLNTAGGDYSFAAGLRAKVRTAAQTGEPATCSNDASCGDEGAFVWADSQNLDFTSGGPDQFVVRAAGGVGVNTSRPSNSLHVVGDVSAAGLPQFHVAQLENISVAGNNSADVLALRIRQTGNPSQFQNFVTFYDGDFVDGDGVPPEDVTLGSIEGNGAGGVVLAASGNDFAEYLPKLDPRERIEPGDVVGVFAGRVSLRTEGAERVMVASTGAIVAGNDPGESRRAEYVLVAFVGQADVRVRGDVRSGDWLVASGRGDGRAVAIRADALEPEQWPLLAGRAWSDAQAQHAVRALVGLSASDAASANLAVRYAAIERENARLAARLDRLEQMLADPRIARR